MYKKNDFAKARAGEMIHYFPDGNSSEYVIKFIQEVTANHVIIQGGARFHKHDGTAIARGNTAYIER